LEETFSFFLYKFSGFWDFVLSSFLENWIFQYQIWYTCWYNA
jgi:hypothetical protein